MDDKAIYARNKSYARETLGLREWWYFSSGSGEEQTLNDNENAFQRILLVPSLFPQSGEVNLKTYLLGREIAFPIGISPTAYHEVLHPDGEIATSGAASDLNVCFENSIHSTKSVTEIAAAFPNVQRWMNLRNFKEKEVLVDLIRKAENARYEAFVVTVDSAVIAKKLSAKRLPFELPAHLKLKNIPSLKSPDSKDGPTLHKIPISWDDIDWLKSITKLPIILKGILTAEDALLAIEHGVAAIQVSNHGGRQLDGSPASIDALAKISQAVQGRIPLFLDGGVRTGADVLKALALGAKAVFLGRAVLFGLHYNGREGVKEVLETMKEQLILAMKHTGCTDVNNVPKNIVQRRYQSRI